MSTASLKPRPEGEVGLEQFLLICKTMPGHFVSQMCWMFAAQGTCGQGLPHFSHLCSTESCTLVHQWALGKVAKAPPRRLPRA